MSEPVVSGPVVIAGGSGFLGRNLARCLGQQGCQVILLSRHAPAEQGPWEHVAWDARSLGDWVRVLQEAAGLVNLVGRSVDCPKTPEHCDEILRSRVEATEVLGKAMRQIDNPPPVWVQMSTAHIYGDPPEVVCDEQSALGYGLAPTVGRAWEEAFHRGRLDSQRGVILRTSFVLGRSGGALPKLVRIARFGLGGTVGHGRQGISWIHEEDMNRIFVRALTDPTMQGVYVATAPNPVSNRTFQRQLRRALRMPIGLPAAGWMVRIGSRLLRTDPELALYGRYCVPRRLLAEGFQFRFPELGPALEDLLRKR